jgi:small subunit ribosomal protein S1
MPAIGWVNPVGFAPLLLFAMTGKKLATRGYMTATQENFAELFESTFQPAVMKPGALLNALVVDLTSDYIIVNAGLKSEGFIPREEFGDIDIQVGDQVEVVVDAADNGFGESKLSHEKAKRVRAWSELEKFYESGDPVVGTISERVKGGFTVELGALRAFLPGSLVDIKPVRDPGYLTGKELEFRVIKMDVRRNNVVVSRRAVLEDETSAERQTRLDELQEGQEIVGIVKNITDYGAFVDLGGIDGLLHITDMAWKRVKHPSEMVNVGDEMRVKVLKFDRDKNRVSLGLKQLGEDPWINIARRYPANTRLHGKITNITDYGCFVQLEEGVEGLVHMSEMDWTNKNIHPSKVVKVDQEVDVMVLEIDEERRRISLGIKQCQENPWDHFSRTFKVGDKVKGDVRSITDFGVFIGLDGGIDGLVHLTDLSWTEDGEKAVRDFKKSEPVEAVILAIDPERERISLGIKQLQDDPMENFLAGYDRAESLETTVESVEDKVAVLRINDELTGILRISDYSFDHTESLSSELKVGDKLEVKIANVDAKGRQIYLSHKALEEAPEGGRYNTAGNVSSEATLGDLLKEQMQGDKKDK